MTDDAVIRDVRTAREAYARLHNFDPRAMVEDLRARDAAGDWQVVRHAPRPPRPDATSAGAAANKSLQM